MPRHTKKYVAASVALIMVALGTGCSNSGSESQTADGKIELEFWNPETDEAEVEVFEKIISAYEDDNPNVDVKLVTIPWSDIFAKWQTALQSGNAPDASIGSVAFGASFQEQGVLEPLNDVVDAIGGEAAFADSASSLVDLSKTEEGDWFTLPLVHNSVVLWYNKPMLEAAGLQPPKTWDELEAAAKAMTHDDQYGILIPSSTSQVTNQSLYSLILSNGGDIVDRDDPNTVTFDEEKSVEALEFYSSLAQYSPPGSGGYDRPEAQAAMTTGKLGMFIYGSWMQSALDAAGPEVAEQFGTVPVPSNGGAGAFMGNLSVFAFKGGEHPEETKDFLSYFYDPKNYEELILVNPTSFFPVLGEVQDSETYQSNEKVVASAELIEAVKTSLPDAWIFGLPNPHAGEWEGLNLIAKAATAVIEQGKDPQEAAAGVADEMRDTIK
ncbi:ABC transporter substrate-binding protein [Mycetocola miduiensis]|uniref:Carbohydrate ABC transporter substrate-binding protein, CUT1 family n=1 Tax=Mycetocola miduiensis TaxID=995034 RepID=A0A1I5AEC3_9MICO|nr:sugar ABC transporter substrate-binding protein [Mycetocola miduiensis]SFN60762.1 carbohydrate ABC transporter substrate-binding protein, CUT1 family [Mycetocola miduiensis]